MAEVKQLVEAALFIAGRAVKTPELRDVSKASDDEVLRALEELSREYAERGSGIEVVVEKNKAVMQLRRECEDAVMFLAPETEMSQAMLKTLAVIAHDEPVTQSSLVKSRGNRVYYYLRKLIDTGFISARKHGRTKILTTTPKFKGYFKVAQIPKQTEEVNKNEQHT